MKLLGSNEKSAQSKYKTFIGMILLTVFILSCLQNPGNNLSDKIEGMLFASAIADAMGGPHEGRSTEDSRKFLEDGNWINGFSEYTPWHQHHWNVYQQTAKAGTYTDDDRMRLSMVIFMINHFQNGNSQPISRKFLAEQIFLQYQNAYSRFQQIDLKYFAADNTEERNKINITRKERFLHLWFCWELAKTATEVYIPENPSIFSPPYIRVSDDPEHLDYSLKWHIKPVESRPITKNIKAQYHKNSYATGQEMPLGLIYLLPVAGYFPGQPKKAFHHVLEIDFFDIGNAPYYPAVMCALIADALGGKKWIEIEDNILREGLSNYLGTEDNITLALIENGVKKGIQIAKKYRRTTEAKSRKQAIQFIFDLHRAFTSQAAFMCTVQEMLFVPIALAAYSYDDINFLIEMGVNYGRDNDTAGSIAATLGGAITGSKELRGDWKTVVQTANPKIDIADISAKLSQFLTGQN